MKPYTLPCRIYISLRNKRRYIAQDSDGWHTTNREKAEVFNTKDRVNEAYTYHQEQGVEDSLEFEPVV